MVLPPLGGSAPPQHRRVLGDELVPALSQSCHFAVFVNPVARSSTDDFFTLCEVHLEHERTTQAACLQRRHEQLSAAGAVAGAFPFRPHTGGELRLALQEGRVVARSPLVFERAPARSMSPYQKIWPNTQTHFAVQRAATVCIRAGTAHHTVNCPPRRHTHRHQTLEEPAAERGWRVSSFACGTSPSHTP